MKARQQVAMAKVVCDVIRERLSQHEKWGEQCWPDGTEDNAVQRNVADIARAQCQQAHRVGRLTFRDILNEECAEAFAESDPEKLRAELIQVAAVAVQWVEKLDRQRAQRMGVEE